MTRAVRLPQMRHLVFSTIADGDELPDIDIFTRPASGHHLNAITVRILNK